MKSKRRNFLINATTAAIIFSSISSIPLNVGAATQLFFDDFESGNVDWVGRGEEVSVELVDTTGYQSESSLFVTGRTQFWNGVAASKTELKAGTTYKISAMIKYENPSYWQQKFELNLQYTQSGSESYPTIGSVTVQSGNWGIAEGQITIPGNAEDIQIYVQTAYTSNPTDQDLMDFYVDDIKCEELGGAEIQQDIKSLKAVYANDFMIGTAVESGNMGIKVVEDMIDKHYNCLTVGNELKPDYVLDLEATKSYLSETSDQTNPQVSLKKASAILDYCDKNNIPVRGHTLVWHSQTPDWFFKENYDPTGEWVSKDIMTKRMENYIKNVMETLEKEYPNVEFYAWDVVNEAFANDTGNMRQPGSDKVSSGQSAWMQVYGDDSFIELAFTYARKYAPTGCKLFYNDYNEYMDSKRDAIYNLAMKLKEKGIIDGIGMQSHLDMNFPSVTMFENAIKKFGQTGLEVQITELDITTSDTSESGLNAQAKRYREIFDLAVKYKDSSNITALILWGLNDNLSWRASKSPLIFDKDYQAKPAFYSIVEGLEEVVTTPTTTTTTAPEIIVGDINKSGLIDLSDLVTLNQYLIKDIDFSADQFFRADATGDSLVDVADVALLKQYLMGDNVKLGAKK